MKRLRAFLQGRPGRGCTGAILLLLAGLIFFQVHSFLAPSPAARQTRQRWMVCAQTGKPFQITLQEGQTFPILSPHSGQRTGYPGELCFWTPEGTPKTPPTVVLLNSRTGQTGPTFCPDCGRLVVPHNPSPPGPPPPTRLEYAQRARQEE